MRGFKVGVQLPEVERHVSWAEQVEIARTAERVGFDSVWVGDHLLYDRPGLPRTGPWEAWSQLAGLAVATERVEIGPLVAATGFHAPTMLAKKAVTIDEMSGGRLILGLGSGWNQTEYDAFGFPFDHRVARFEEAFHLIRRLVRGERITEAGTYYSVEDAEILPAGPRPTIPMMIGSNGPRMLSITLPHVDAWNAWWAWFDNRPSGLAPVLADLDRACEDVGRDPVTLQRTVAVLVQLPEGGGRAMGHDHATHNPITGTPPQIAEQLAEFADLGVGHIQLVVDPITVDSVEWLGAVLEELDR